MALVVINEGPLAELLRSAEGANHTNWSPRIDTFKEKYTNKGEISFIVESVMALMNIVRGDNEKPVGGIATKFFSAKITDQPNKTSKKKRRKKGLEKETPLDQNIESSPKRYRLEKVDRGFKIVRGDPGSAIPAKITVRVAYDVMRGSAWKAYDKADFDFTSQNTKISIASYNSSINIDKKGNRFTIKPEADDFEVYVTGFDTNRDLIIDPKSYKEETDDAEPTELYSTQNTVGA